MDAFWNYYYSQNALLWFALKGVHVCGWGVKGFGGGACLLIWRAFPIIQLVRNVGQRPWCSSCSPTLESKCPRLTLYIQYLFSFWLVRKYINRNTRKKTETLCKCRPEVKVAPAHSPGGGWSRRCPRGAELTSAALLCELGCMWTAMAADCGVNR